MKRTLLTAAALVMIAAAGRADPPGRSESPFTNSTTVILLDTLKVVEGNFGREPNGDYSLRVGRKTKVFAQKNVLFAGDSRVAVNQYLMSRAKPDAAPAVPEIGLGDYNPDALKVYPSRIQPIVGNLCASCHARPECPGRFRLAAIAPGYADPESAAANRRAVLSLVNRGDPGASLLLKMMTTRHGPQREPAIPFAHHPALKRVELWAYWVGLPAGSAEPATVPKRVAARVGAEPAAGEPASYDAAAFNKAMHGGR